MGKKYKNEDDKDEDLQSLSDGSDNSDLFNVSTPGFATARTDEDKALALLLILIGFSSSSDSTLKGSGLKILKSLYLAAEKPSSESTLTTKPAAHDVSKTKTINLANTFIS